jgi:predicted solute-binding protein
MHSRIAVNRAPRAFTLLPVVVAVVALALVLAVELVDELPQAASTRLARTRASATASAVLGLLLLD